MQSNITYVVYAPGWVHWSAGIKVLHYLCHGLNSQGFIAYMALHGPTHRNDINENLITPILTREVIRKLARENSQVIAIYPESIVGNPLNAPNVVRWILNFPQLLGGETDFKHDYVLAYSKTLSRSFSLQFPIEPPVCFIPAIKIQEIDDVDNYQSGGRPSGAIELIYAQKYRALGGTEVIEYQNSREIERFGPNSTSRSVTLKMLQDAKLLHVYENSTIITEACLLGTPVICHENEFFHELIASDELAFTGISWDEQLIEIPDINFNRSALIAAEEIVPENIRTIFTQIEMKLKEKSGTGRIRLPRRGFITEHSIERARVVLRQKGFRSLVRFFFNYINR